MTILPAYSTPRAQESSPLWPVRLALAGLAVLAIGCSTRAPLPEDVVDGRTPADVPVEAGTADSQEELPEDLAADPGGDGPSDTGQPGDESAPECGPVGELAPCDDDNPCTQDECGPSGCVYKLLDGLACDDGIQCTTGDSCVKGICKGAGSNCSDGLDCTLDLCTLDGDCVFPVKAGSCLIGDTCFGDGDVGPLPCLACRPDLSIHAWSDAPDGSACGAGDPCVVDEACLSGACIGTPKCDDGLWCTLDLCDPDSGSCVFAPPAAGACLIESTCWPDGAAPADTGGQCRSCDAQKSTFAWSFAPDGTPCLDYLTCTTAPACLAGECVPGGQACQDGNPCTSDACVAAKCQHDPFDDGLVCPDDGFPCTSDLCAKGQCEHLLDTGCLVEGQCYDPGQSNPLVPCLACLPDSSKSSWSVLVDGTPCDDGLFCTVGDQCSKAQCHGSFLDCPGNACAAGKCNEALDKCELQPVGDGAACDDQDPCTITDSCLGGMCTGTTKDCAAAAGGSSCVKAWCSPAGTPDAGKCLSAPLVAGTPCDDGLACTSATACLTGGICGGGKPVTDDECFASVAGPKVCRIGHCMEPLGCLLVNGPDGVPCLVLHGKGSCLAGGCKVTSCSPGYKDCNGTPDDGCETLLATSLAHCGACGNACELASATSACILGKCEVKACLNGALDCNGLPGDGCEADPQADPSHCGKCGMSCSASDPWQQGVCQQGVCFSSACPPGTLNLDGDPGNGCEGLDVLWVDADAGVPQGQQDGSQEHPFDTIGEAVLAALPGQAIYVQPGTYPEGNLELTAPGTVIAGTSATEVILAVPPGVEKGLVIRADSVSISRLSVQGGRIGIEFSGNPMAPIQAGLVEDVILSGQMWPDVKAGESVAGVAIRFADEVSVVRTKLSGIKGPTGSPGCTDPAGSGGDAIGILVQWSLSSRVEDCTILAVVGGAGGPGGAAGCADLAPGTGGRATGIRVEDSLQVIVVGNSVSGPAGGAGGLAGAAGQLTAGIGGPVAGIELHDSSLCEVAGNNIAALTGGAGGKAGSPPKLAGTGGIGVGIGLYTSESNWIHHNSFGVVQGGVSVLLPGEKAADGVQVGYAVYFGPGSESNSVDPSNHIGVAPIVYLYGVDGHSITGQNIQTENWINPTNLGGLVVMASANILVTGNKVTSVRGERGSTSPGAGHPGMPGGDAVGIRIQDCVGCEVSENAVAAIQGGAGGFPEPEAAGLPGGSASGILLQGDQTCTVRSNGVSAVTGGPASFGTPAGEGGEASAVDVVDGLDLLIEGNGMTLIAGGPGGGSGASAGPGGGATALSLVGLGEPLGVSNNEAWAVDGGIGNPAGESACVRFDASAAVTMNHFTCASVGQKAGTGHGFVLAEKGPGTLKLTNSIVAHVSGNGLWNHPANPVPALKSLYCDFWKCKLGEVNHASKDNTLILDPQFIDLAVGNLSVVPSSGCIDAGDPTNNCVNEPSPNGCRVNIGADGNTPAATPKAGASHCPNCPQK